MGALEKTDRIDTGMIAWYAETKRLVPTPPSSEKQQRFMALVLRMRQLTDLRTAQNNQRRLVEDPDALASFSAVVATINQQIRSLEAKVIELIDTDPLWLALDTAFREIKGVADRTVARLLAHLPEIGTLSGKAAAKLTGSPRSPTIAARGPASVRCAADAKRCDPSFTRSPNSSGATIPTSRPFTIRCVRPANRRTSCASRWHASCWCG
jgi:transposase